MEIIRVMKLMGFKMGKNLSLIGEEKCVQVPTKEANFETLSTEGKLIIKWTIREVG
jgi:hypothetical protein